MRFFITLLILSFSFFGIAIADSPLNQEDAYIMLDNLLEITPMKSDIKEQLKEYKKWEKVFVKYSGKDKYSIEQMKIYLFLGFIAEINANVHTQEEIDEEIVSIFSKQKDLFLSILKKHPFLIPSACSSLRDHFDVFSNKTEKALFLKSHESDIMHGLGQKEGDICLKLLR